MRREDYSGKTTGPGRQPRARMPLIPRLWTFTKDFEFIDMFPRHLRSVRKSKKRVAILFGRNTDRRAKQSTSKVFSMSIGAREGTSSSYRVSRRVYQLVRSYLMEKGRGRCIRKVSLLSGITILPESHRSSLCNRQVQLANGVHTGRIYPFVAP